MTKIRRITEFQRTFRFQSPEENFESLYAQFLSSNLGKIYQAIPWKKLVAVFQIKESTKGPTCLFSPRGKLALMFLKHYACCSDARLVEQLNANLHYQFFCDLLLTPENKIDNFKIVSHIRCELSGLLHIDQAQKCLSQYWLPYMKDLSCATTDATCYESELRFPTSQKLLWEAVDWNYGQMKQLCKYLKLCLPRTKYIKWKRRYFAYSRKRRKPAKDKRSLTRSLLLLLDKTNHELDHIEQSYAFEICEKYFERRKVIRKIYEQQAQLFHTGEKPKNRIVSIAKSYIRPIVRGKENELPRGRASRYQNKLSCP